MATKYFIYRPDSLNNPNANSNSGNQFWAIQADDAVMALYPDLVKKYSDGGGMSSATAPTAYDTKADADTAHGSTLNEGALQPRGLTIQIAGFGTAFLPILNQSVETISGTDVKGNEWEATLDNASVAGPSPFPFDAAAEGNLEVQVIAYRGEQRTQN
jgi:hypothetical protein